MTINVVVLGVVVRMVGYGAGGAEVASATIGTSGESWDDRRVEIASAAGEIAFVHFLSLSSADAKYHFCLDDLTIVPVPEPASLVALCAGLIPLAFRMRRR